MTSPPHSVTLDQIQNGSGTILEIKDLVKTFTVGGGMRSRHHQLVHAVDGVSLTLRAGDSLGLVGESGCGKSTLSRLILRLLRPTSGSIEFQGTDITRLAPRKLRAVRREMRLLFQDPYASLNPRMTVGDIVAEPFRIHGEGAHARQGVRRLLDLVGLRSDAAGRFPHEFSGGQRQRIGIARALALDPSLIVLDEPVSALDVSVQAQIVNLLQDLQHELGFAFLFIAHDLAVVRHVSTQVAVMYLGKIVEFGSREQIFTRPTHPYTQALLSAVPISDPDHRGHPGRLLLAGDPPSPLEPPPGCRFHTRCWKAEPRCHHDEPHLVERAADPHPSACHFAAVTTGGQRADVS